MTLRLINTSWLLSKPCSHAKISIFRIHLSQFSSAAKKEEVSETSSTVDQADIKRHTKQLNEWWNPNGPMKALHQYNLIRIPFIRDGLLQNSGDRKTITPLKNMKILDVGCGGGILSEPLAKLGAEVTGLDASQELIQCARQHSLLNPKLADNKPVYTCTIIEEHAENYQNHYDGVVASEVIEHVNNKELFIKSCVKVLKPGGRIFFTTPNRTRLSEISVIYLAEYLFKIAPKGTHQIEKFTTPTELTFLLERSDCHVELIHGIFYNVLTNRWHWVHSQAFVFALQAVKLQQSAECNA